MRRFSAMVGMLLLTWWLVACQQVEVEAVAYDPANIRFSGGEALAIEEFFVESFPNRASGEVENRLAAEWLDQTLSDFGFQCLIDEWEVINYSRTVPLNNVICELPGESSQEIMLLAHLDHSPFAGEGADDGGSGVAVLVQLAEILSEEQPWPYTVTLVITDGSVYGGLGARRLLESHPDLERIEAAIVLDNLGHELYEGLAFVPVGQFAGYGSLELQLTGQEASVIQEGGWIPRIPEPLEQIRDQVIPFSIDDQGPLIAQRLPAIGLNGWTQGDREEQSVQLLYSPVDTIGKQSAEVLQQSGSAVEGLYRQLQTLETSLANRAPYLYYAESEQQLRPGFILLVLIALVLIFFVVSYYIGSKEQGGYLAGIVAALPHFLGLWLPLLASLLVLYLFVAIGLVEDYDVYPATFNDPVISQPKYIVLLLWIIALWEFFQLGRRAIDLYMQQRPAISFNNTKSLALVIIGLGAAYVLMLNPMSVILIFPLLTWLFISGRQGRGKVLDIILLLLGTALVLISSVYLGFQILGNSVAILWYFLLLIAIRTISFSSALAITAMIAAGISLVIPPPTFHRRDVEQSAEEFDPASSAP